VEEPNGYTANDKQVDTLLLPNDELHIDFTLQRSVFQHQTYSQGFYGNFNGRECKNNYNTLMTITNLLSAGDVIIGKSGRSITLRQSEAVSDADCIIKRLPAGGTPAILPSGNKVFNNSCNISSVSLKNNKFNNVLLGQAITLGLNLRLDQNLKDLVITDKYMITRPAKYINGICMDGNDIPDSSKQPVAYLFPQSVLSALCSLYTSPTVSNLFDLMNRGLANLDTKKASLSDINAAVTIINEAFDGGRFLVGFSSSPNQNAIIVPTDLSQHLPKEFSLFQNYPNPFNPVTSIEYAIPEIAHITITIYNVLGQEVKRLVDEVQGSGYRSVEWNSTNELGRTVSSGVYFFKLEAFGLEETGKYFIQMKKMLLVK
jgi:hypothetical protein